MPSTGLAIGMPMWQTDDNLLYVATGTTTKVPVCSYESLNSVSDVGTSSTQVARGNHTHSNYLSSSSADTANGLITFDNGLRVSDDKKMAAGDSDDVYIQHNSGGYSELVSTLGAFYITNSANGLATIFQTKSGGGTSQNTLQLAYNDSTFIGDLEVTENLGVGTGGNNDERLHVEETSATPVYLKIQSSNGSSYTAGIDLTNAGAGGGTSLVQRNSTGDLALYQTSFGTNYGAGLTLGLPANGGHIELFARPPSTSSTEKALVLTRYNGLSTSTLLAVNAGGSVGIGTGSTMSAIDEKLHIESTSSGGTFVKIENTEISTPNTGIIITTAGTNANTWNLRNMADVPYFEITDGTAQLQYQTNGQLAIKHTAGHDFLINTDWASGTTGTIGGFATRCNNSVGTSRKITVINGELTTATSNAEVGALSFSMMDGGSQAEQMHLSPVGLKVGDNGAADTRLHIEDDTNNCVLRIEASSATDKTARIDLINTYSTGRTWQIANNSLGAFAIASVGGTSALYMDVNGVYSHYAGTGNNLVFNLDANDATTTRTVYSRLKNKIQTAEFLLEATKGHLSVRQDSGGYTAGPEISLQDRTATGGNVGAMAFRASTGRADSGTDYPFQFVNYNGTSLTNKFLIASNGVVTVTNKVQLSGHTVWTDVADGSMSNSYTNYGASYQVRHRKYPDNRVEIQGLINPGTLNTTAWTLPVGKRPNKILFFECRTNTGPGYFVVNTNGTVVPTSGGTNWFSLNCSFYADQ